MAADRDRSLTDSLASVHERLWDPAVCMDRMAPGVTPGLDLSSLDLHSVRESALGALLDLHRGDTDRAVASLRAVLTHQYDAPGRPWDGTFRVTAEQADPPGDDAAEWLHYDPNWRQFLGTTLLVVLLDHRARLPDDLVDALEAAVVRCALGEPEGRIPEWYTNPNLMHAWVSAHAGRLSASPELVERGVRRARRTVERLERLGDVDEYNSPTYDGVDLIAASLWVVHPPAPEFVDWGRLLIDRLCGRLSVLVDPDLGTVCGPYSRAYGLSMDRYVSLLGVWLHGAGVGGVLPPVLDPSTDHVHDLYFVPLIERLAADVLPPWRIDPVRAERRHVQRFGDAVATSILRPGCSVGWASGPVPDFAADQYVPFVAHCRPPDGAVAHLGLRPGAGVRSLDVVESGPDTYQVRIESAGRPASVTLDGLDLSLEGDRLVDRVGAAVVEVDRHRGSHIVSTPGGWSVVGGDPVLRVVLTASA